ncbi:type II toxin-antitoxin system death-on-curing family toxin [Bacillus sp. V59.32b]|uniref:type II toxin-antitoxin system death-on-curing family toxin n=1 Tax=Bacillus sp. V59.32b TaxID=1758642 RepID=UPI000E3D1799|nr:type II toxin-antitoxin system death-on-curing family toxin [Bacillus sp. V59.32b]RFU66809.1 type II toxin-antitoxin system death-on-curing family toxin [Bacillus sp. V59.32b]
MHYLSAEHVIFLNSHQINLYTPGEMMGVKDYKLLESAVNRPKQSAFGEDAYPTIIEKAAALYESVAKNHAFHNANKRTAFAGLYMFLGLNGFHLKVHPKQAEDFTVRMVADKESPVSFDEVCDWIETYIQKRP